MTYPIQHQAHAVTTIILQALQITIAKILAMVSLMLPNLGLLELNSKLKSIFIVYRAVTPNSSLETSISSNNNNNSNNGNNHLKGSTIISADSSVASSISLDDEDERPVKVKKKEEVRKIRENSGISPVLSHFICSAYSKIPFNFIFKVFKKEIHPKGGFYGTFEMQQRREVSNDQFGLVPTVPNAQLTTPSPSSNSAIHNSYGPTPQAISKQNPSNVKSRFGNAPEAYYGSGGGAGAGYMGGKHPNPNAEYFGKYEAEFIAHQQKMSNQMPPFGNQPLKHEFHDGKPSAEFLHSIKGEMHHANMKNMPPAAVAAAATAAQQQLHGKNVDFHYGKTPNSHMTGQNFYNHHGNADGNHQISMQYNSNQYFGNEFANANEMDYYEQKPVNAQGAYYDMYNNANNNGNEFTGAIGNAYTATPSNGQLPNDHCEHFGYPQYYDANHHPHHPHPGNASIPVQQSQAHQANPMAHAPNPINTNQPQFHHAINPAQSYHPNQQINGTVGAVPSHIPNAHMDNSNSSSEFNFLSNLANDFTPEYYQLS